MLWEGEMWVEIYLEPIVHRARNGIKITCVGCFGILATMNTRGGKNLQARFAVVCGKLNRGDIGVSHASAPPPKQTAFTATGHLGPCDRSVQRQRPARAKSVIETVAELPGAIKVRSNGTCQTQHKLFNSARVKVRLIQPLATSIAFWPPVNKPVEFMC